MGGYAKLFSDIVDSSIWDEDAETRIIWVTMLALADPSGFVRGSVGWLAGKARVSNETCARAIKRFESPDPHSRNPEYEGRRIESFDRGWLLLNYVEHRDRLSNDVKASQTRERVRRFREKAALRNASSVTTRNKRYPENEYASESGNGESPERGPDHYESPEAAGVPGGTPSNSDPAGDSKARLATIRAGVREVFEYFNTKTGSQIPPHPANLLPIQEILEDPSFGATVETAKLAIDWCWSEWRDSKAMCGNIRIKTIFKPSNFSGYAENGRRKFSKHSRTAAPKQFRTEIERLEHEFVAIRDKVEAARAEAAWSGNSFREQRAVLARAYLAKGEPLLAAAQRALDAARNGGARKEAVAA